LREKRKKPTYIGFSFLAVFSCCLDRAHRLVALTEIEEVLVGDYLSLDETSLEVTVDSTSSLGCETSSGDGPASNLLLTSYTYVSSDALEGKEGTNR
jgi:hypothetical protein